MNETTNANVRPAPTTRLATLAPTAVAPGRMLEARVLRDVLGREVALPDPSHRVHLQLRRFAGCPVCNLHLRSIVVRHSEIVSRGIREVVVFHGRDDELREYGAGVPFSIVGDEHKALHRELGVGSSVRSLFDPRVWPTIVRAIFRSLVEIIRGRERAPSARPTGGRFGLPADFLIDTDGRVLACKYGEHADDQWSVDELLAEHERTGDRSRI